MVRSRSESPATEGSVNVFAVTLPDRSRNSLEGVTPGRSELQPPPDHIAACRSLISSVKECPKFRY